MCRYHIRPKCVPSIAFVESETCSDIQRLCGRQLNAAQAYAVYIAHSGDHQAVCMWCSEFMSASHRPVGQSGLSEGQQQLLHAVQAKVGYQFCDTALKTSSAPKNGQVQQGRAMSIHNRPLHKILQPHYCHVGSVNVHRIGAGNLVGVSHGVVLTVRAPIEVINQLPYVC